MTSPYRIRPAATWVQAREDYLSGMDAESVCMRHDLGISAFRRRARKFGWRRLDQAPAPARAPEPDLSIYEDVVPDEQIRLAELYFKKAISEGRAAEAARWRRLWKQISEDRCAFLDAFEASLSDDVRAALPDQVQALTDWRDASEEAQADTQPLAPHPSGQGPPP